MSTRTIIEINHDYFRTLEAPDFAAHLRTAVFTGGSYAEQSVDWLKPAVRILGTRHHSEPEWTALGSMEPGSTAPGSKRK